MDSIVISLFTVFIYVSIVTCVSNELSLLYINMADSLGSVDGSHCPVHMQEG